MKYKIRKVPEYQAWFDEQAEKSKLQILKRLELIERDGYFGDHKLVNEPVWELKWVNGRRVYYANLSQTEIMLLLGGNKNGQSKDITQAKRILKKYTNG
jgi:putative addiction module killer protein